MSDTEPGETAMTNDLIHRLETAAAGSRELDALVYCAVHGYPFKKFITTKDAYSQTRRHISAIRIEGGDDISIMVVPHFTTSIDAAMTGIPEGWVVLSIKQYAPKDKPSGTWGVELRHIKPWWGGGVIGESIGGTACAINAASLKAREAGDE